MALLRDRVPSFNRYPFSIPAVRHLTHLDFQLTRDFLNSRESFFRYLLGAEGPIDA